MRYIGSKLRLTNFIETTVKKYCGEDLSEKVFCDLFAGTGVVGRHFCPKVKKVISNDIEKYAFISNYATLKGFSNAPVSSIIEELNKSDGTECSSLFQAYSEGGTKGRLYFSHDNGKKIAGARQFLSRLDGFLPFNEFIAVLLSIIDGADKVANTMSTYGAYAKKLKSNSIKPVVFSLPKQAENASENNEVYLMDANECIKSISGDILYLDPPYNNRQYGSNYHVLNAIAVGEAPETDSVTGVAKDEYNKSDYCREKTVAAALENLIKSADFEWIFLSYNNEGLLKFEDIRRIMEKYGEYFVESTDYQRYKADNSRNQAADGVVEYIHILHKGFFSNGMSENDIAERKSMADAYEKTESKAENGPEYKIKSKIKTITLHPHHESIEKDTIEIANAIKHNFSPEEFENLYLERPLPILETPEFSSKFVPVVSPMNYMGGKKKLIKDFVTKYFPQKVDTFVDLFCGGATVGVNAVADKVIFNDNITPLIEMYRYLYVTPVELSLHYIDFTISSWGLTPNEEDEPKYYAFRDCYNATPVEQRNPLDLFILMAFSFNNQIRFAVNKNWKFNIPFGANRSSFNETMRKNFIGFVKALQSKYCTFMSEDFANFNMERQDGENVMIYADPPYLVSQATYNDGWNEVNECELLNRLDWFDENGYKFALSNVLENKGKKNEILAEWVEKNSYRYKVIHIEKSYANSYYHRKERESKTDEVLIINY